MARQYIGPFKQKKNGVEYGSYRGYHPGLQKVVSLGTTDIEAARTLLGSFHGNAGHKESPRLDSNAANLSSVRVPSVQTPGSTVLDFDSAIQESNAKEETSDSLLEDWSRVSAESSNAGVPGGASKPIEAPKADTGPSVLGAFFKDTPTSKAKGAQKGLTPEQSAKLANGLKKTVTQLNVIIVGAGVQMFGRMPAPLDDEEIELLQLGWEMWLDEMFVKRKPKPWMLIVVGNCMVACAMYLNGTPKAKEPKKMNGQVNDAAKAGAPGMAQEGAKLPNVAQPRPYESGKVWGKQ